MSPRAVIIDDDRNWSQTVAAVLRRMGFRVRIARTAKAGFRLSAAAPTALIMLDLNFRGEEGLRILKRLRRSGNWRPVVVMSADDGKETEAAARAAGASQFICKPLALARLKSLLEPYKAAQAPDWDIPKLTYWARATSRAGS